MKKILNQIINALFYGGIGKETFSKVAPYVQKDNKRSVQLISIIASIIFMFISFITVINKPDVPYQLYLASALICLAIYLVVTLIFSSYPGIANKMSVLFSAIILAIGIFIAYEQKEERTTMLLPLFVLVSLVFCYRPIYLVCMLTVSEVVYLFIMYNVQPFELFYVNLVNTFVFTILGGFTGFSMTLIKYKKYETTLENQTIIEIDPLTGIYNRYCWKKELEKIVNEQVPITILSFDVDGLKKTNDSMGHIAGDELIIAASKCICDVFKEYGKVYRIGGDEFSVIIYEHIDYEKLYNEFKDKTRKWQGNRIKSFSVAVGMSYLDHDFEERIDEVIHNADIRMYEDKKNSII